MFRADIRNHLLVYLITDLLTYHGRSALEIVRAALDGGVTMVQLREKRAPLFQVVADGQGLRELCRQYGVPFLVNDRIDLALLLDADGVHVGQDDLPCLCARKLLGDDKIIGVSAGTMDEAHGAMSQGADYLGVGSIYATITKKDAGPPIGTSLITDIKQQWPDVCMVAIGGIQTSNAASVIEAGADGVAVVSAITRQHDPRLAAEQLCREIHKINSP